MHRMSGSDREFVTVFEAGALAPAEFTHRAHLRLAYCLLCDGDGVAATLPKFRQALLRFLARNAIDPAKYSETLTQAWLSAVHHFMQQCAGSQSFDEFIKTDERLLDTKIMLTHYSAEVLFSQVARARFVEPNLQPIPVHD